MARPGIEKKWYPLDDWHEDLGSCLFMFFDKDGEWLNCEFTSPITSDWEDSVDGAYFAFFLYHPCYNEDIEFTNLARITQEN